MSTGITTQGGTDRLNRILKLYHSTATQILRITGGDPTARIMVNNAFALPVQGILSAIDLSNTQAFRPLLNSLALEPATERDCSPFMLLCSSGTNSRPV